MLADAGFTRVSFGMQSAVPHVLKVLDRTHTPSRVPQVVQWARDAGLAVSLDLIYGTPGESLADWQYSLETALSLRAGPHQRLRADRGGRHQAGRADPPRRGPGHRRRRPRRQVRARGRLITAAGLELVRGQQLGPHAGTGLPAQPRLLARRRLVGHRPGRALARRRRALVERQAPHRVCRPAAQAELAGRRTGNPGRRDPER